MAARIPTGLGVHSQHNSRCLIPTHITLTAQFSLHTLSSIKYIPTGVRVVESQANPKHVTCGLQVGALLPVGRKEEQVYSKSEVAL
jgi:hypothetical protein